jgi:hypothetical protein
VVTDIEVTTFAAAYGYWAQHKGIAAVEVRVNGGPWREAQLAKVSDPSAQVTVRSS